MSSLDLTREWLNTVLRPYAARERIVSEVMDILAARRTLAVKTDAFSKPPNRPRSSADGVAYDTGQTALLLLLHGTLPINYRGATYQIPLNVWVPHDYPRNPPLAFVVPTKEMGVRKGREVEPGGRVKDEVVQGWWSGWEPKSIEVLLRHLAAIFSATPPVFARPPETVSSPTRPAGQVSGGMSPQYANGPSAAAGPSYQQQPPQPPSRPYQPPPQSSFAGQRPSTEYLPQYHSAPTPPPHPYAQHTHSRQSSASYPQTAASPIGQNGVPPVPYRPQTGIPPRQGSLPPSSPSGPDGPVLPQRPYLPGQALDGMQGPPRPMSVGYGPPPGQMGPERYVSPPPTNGPGSPGGMAYQHARYPPGGVQPPTGYPPNGYNPPQQPMYTGPPQQPPSNHQQARSPHPSGPPQPAPPAPVSRRPQTALDLMSASDGPSDLSPTSPGAPPPIPPSKPPPPSTMHLHSILLPHLTSSLPPLLSSLHATRTHLLERKEDLASGEPAIKDEMARLEAVLKVCEATAGKLGDVVQRGQSRVGELEARGEVGVDEVVCGISIVHNQLIDLVAEDNAIDDTIYHITRAFEAERLDLDRFLKSIRSLAREQYMKRALIERILQGMGQKQGW